MIVLLGNCQLSLKQRSGSYSLRVAASCATTGTDHVGATIAEILKLAQSAETESQTLSYPKVAICGELIM